MQLPNQNQRLIVILTVSVMLEITQLAGIFRLPDPLYHGSHLLFMAALIGSHLFCWRLSQNRLSQKTAMFLAMGALCTMVGDFINSGISPVEPVSSKLTWALLLFGIGYSLYNFALYRNWQSLSESQKANPVFWRNALLAVVILVNIAGWFQHLEMNLRGHELLYYGSFVFNATIYVAMPTMALWLWLGAADKTAALIVLFGAVLIPFSDLVLFASWLRGGDPAVPSFELYAYNWILYYGGQVMFGSLSAWE